MPRPGGVPLGRGGYDHFRVLGNVLVTAGENSFLGVIVAQEWLVH